jgi:hypothetical protein
VHTVPSQGSDEHLAFLAAGGMKGIVAGREAREAKLRGEANEDGDTPLPAPPAPAPTKTEALLANKTRVPAALRNFSAGGKALHMPYRRHQLTLLLKDCFTNPCHRTLVVACCSPSATDVEHSVRTLQQVAQMRGAEDDVCRETRIECARTVGEVEDVMPFRRWPAERVRAWLSSLEHEDLALVAGVLPSSVDGKELLKWSVARLTHACCAGDAAKAAALYEEIRAESARVDAHAADKRVRARGVAGRIDRYQKPKEGPADPSADVPADASSDVPTDAPADAPAESPADPIPTPSKAALLNRSITAADENHVDN